MEGKESISNLSNCFNCSLFVYAFSGHRTASLEQSNLPLENSKRN